MFYKISLGLFLMVGSLFFILPKPAAAFWWFDKPQVATSSISILDDQAKTNLAVKYKLWEVAFEKKDVEAVIASQDKFLFTVPEINYLFATEVKNIKSPTLTDVGVTSSNGNINVAANFHKFISGRFSFIAKPVSVENKLRLQLMHVKFYGFSVPTAWLEEPVNNALDNYFSFLYKDSRYQGFTFISNDNSLQFKPTFKK